MQPANQEDKTKQPNSEPTTNTERSAEQTISSDQSNSSETNTLWATSSEQKGIENNNSTPNQPAGTATTIESDSPFDPKTAVIIEDYNRQPSQSAEQTTSSDQSNSSNLSGDQSE